LFRNDSVLILGGYGTFGQLVAKELCGRQVQLTIAGRSLVKAKAFAQMLNATAVAIDVNDSSSYLDVLSNYRVVVNCAGPFSRFNSSLPEACIRAKCHYVDIADDRKYVAAVRAMNDAFAEDGITAVFGCSSLPAISCAAALVALDRAQTPVVHACSILFIGNANPKGVGAVTSAAQLIGRRIETPQGVNYGFADREVVELPHPFGSRSVLNFESPDYDLLPELLNTKSVSVTVGFELSLTNAMFATLARLAPRFGRWLIPLLSRVSGLVGHFGSSGGVVMSQLHLKGGSTQSAAVVAKRDGQRMAVLPAVYVVEQIVKNDENCPVGAVSAYEVLGPRVLIDRIVSDGFQFYQGGSG